MNGGEVEVGDQDIKVKLKKKKNLPQLLSNMNNFASQKYSWAGSKKLIFEDMSIS